MDIDPRLSGPSIPPSSAPQPTSSPSTAPEPPNSSTPSVERYTPLLPPLSRDQHSTHSQSGYSTSQHQHSCGLPPIFSPSRSLTPLAASAPAPGSVCSPPSSIITSPAAAAPAASSGSSSHPDQKRPRACESCRTLKVRCEPTENDPTGSCRRCLKAKRDCIFTAPSRKRQKKADSRVAELEKKIDALTASLNATRQAQGTGMLHGDVHMGAEDDDHDQDDVDGECVTPGPSDTGKGELSSAASRVPHTAKRRRYDNTDSSGYLESEQTPANENQAPSQGESIFNYPFVAPKGSRIAVPSYTRPDEGFTYTYEYLDVVDRQLLNTEMATAIFNHYNHNLAEKFPAVVFPPGTKVEDVRRKTPMLFLAVLAAASGTSHPDLNRALQKEITKAFADRIMVNGEKSLELVQALLVTTIWYYPPEHYEELKFYMLTHQAAVMALDIGMGKKTGHVRSRIAGMVPATKGPGGRDMCFGRIVEGLATNDSRCPGESGSSANLHIHGPRCPKFPFPDPCSIESRRTLLACYWLCSNVAVSLRRPNLLQFTNFMAECIDVLESSPEAAKTDKTLCQWVKIQRIADDIETAYAFDDSSATLSIHDSRVQYMLKGFSRQLEEWKSKAQDQGWTKSLEISYHVVTLYAHEIALHVDHNVDDFRPPFTESILRESSVRLNVLLTPFHIDALSTCLSSAHAILNTYLSFTVAEIRVLPVFNFVRAAYALVILIKLYLAASYSKSEWGKLVERESLKVDEYAERIIQLLGAAAENDRCRFAGKFIMILIMLRTWYHSRKSETSRSFGAEGAAGKEVSGTGSRSGPSEATETAAGKRFDLGENLNNTPSAEQTSPSSSMHSRKVPGGDLMEGVQTPGSIEEVVHTPATTASRTDEKQPLNSGLQPPPTPLHLLSNAAIEESASLSSVSTPSIPAQNFSTVSASTTRTTVPQSYTTPAKWPPPSSSSPGIFPLANVSPILSAEVSNQSNVYTPGESSTSSMGQDSGGQGVIGVGMGMTTMMNAGAGAEVGYQGDLFVDDMLWSLIDGNMNIFDWT